MFTHSLLNVTSSSAALTASWTLSNSSPARIFATSFSIAVVPISQGVSKERASPSTSSYVHRIARGVPTSHLALLLLLLVPRKCKSRLDLLKDLVLLVVFPLAARKIALFRAEESDKKPRCEQKDKGSLGDRGNGEKPHVIARVISVSMTSALASAPV